MCVSMCRQKHIQCVLHIQKAVYSVELAGKSKLLLRLYLSHFNLIYEAGKENEIVLDVFVHMCTL